MKRRKPKQVLRVDASRPQTWKHIIINMKRPYTIVIESESKRLSARVAKRIGAALDGMR